jgi:hypothetical protein
VNRSSSFNKTLPQTPPFYLRPKFILLYPKAVTGYGLLFVKIYPASNCLPANPFTFFLHSHGNTNKHLRL